MLQARGIVGHDVGVAWEVGSWMAVAVLVLVPAYGNDGLWAALIISFVARGITLGLRYPSLERSVG